MKYRLLFLILLFMWSYSCVNINEEQELDEVELNEDGLSRSIVDISGLAEPMNRFLGLADVNEFNLIHRYATLYDTVFDILDLRQKWYESILSTNGFAAEYAARVYKALRIDSGYKRAFQNDMEVATYLKNQGVPEMYYRSVVNIVLNSIDKLHKEITQELENLKNEVDRPIAPDRPSEPKPIRYTLSETVKKAMSFWGTWEEISKGGVSGSLFVPLEQFDFIDVACLVDNYNRQNLYTYDDFAFSTPRKAEGFQAIMKYVNNAGTMILLEARVHYEDSHTFYLYLIDAQTYEICDRLEVGTCYRHDFNDRFETEADTRRFIVKDWLFDKDYTVVVGELKTDIAAKFNEDFGTLEAEVIRTTYKYNGRKFVQVEQKSAGKLQYYSENIYSNSTPLAYD